MGIKERWAESREQQREAKEAAEARFRRLTKAEELRRMGVSVFSTGGVLDSAITEQDLDARIEAEKQRQADLYKRFTGAGTVTTFSAFGVQVLKDDNVVYTIGIHSPGSKRNYSRELGSLTGAEAIVTDGTAAFSLGKAALMPLATAPLARKETADALIVFADGTVHSLAVDGSHAVREARKQCVQFNARAGSMTARQAPSSPSDGDGDTAARLRQLDDLLRQGLLRPDEYETKRRAIIDSI